MTDQPQDVNEEQEPQENEPKAVKLVELSESIQNAAKEAGWNELTKVQAISIPFAFSGKDLMVQSHTGSGKTGAFVLPMLDMIDSSKKSCQALILVPTRELASQVCSEANMLFEGHDLECAAVYGGVSYKPQIDAFKKGVQVIVGTPGRILDHLIKKNLNLKDISTLILDEADRMLSMGFYPDMVKLKNFMPKKPRKSFMFSATFPMNVVNVSKMFLKNPEMLNLSSNHIHALETTHEFYNIPMMTKDRWLMKLIELENPASAIVFCNTKVKVHYITEVLKRFGYDADELSADLSQNQREKVLTRIKKNELRFLVATDIAARGIDISKLSHVFHYETPEDHEAYIHRSGRTGRAGASGKVISLSEGVEAIELKKIAKKFKIDLEEKQLPEDETIEKLVAQRVVALLDAKMRNRDNLQKERMRRFDSLVAELSSSQDTISLLTMLLDDYYHEQMHESNTTLKEEKEPAPEKKTSPPQKRSFDNKNRGRRKPNSSRPRTHRK